MIHGQGLKELPDFVEAGYYLIIHAWEILLPFILKKSRLLSWIIEVSSYQINCKTIGEKNIVYIFFVENLPHVMLDFLGVQIQKQLWYTVNHGPSDRFLTPLKTFKKFSTNILMPDVTKMFKRCWFKFINDVPIRDKIWGVILWISVLINCTMLIIYDAKFNVKLGAWVHVQETIKFIISLCLSYQLELSKFHFPFIFFNCSVNCLLVY